MMYDSFFRAYQAFQNAQLENPLLETLHLIDLLSNGAFRSLDRRCLEQDGVDLPQIVQERQKGKPLEYSLGRATFMGLSLYSSPAALIPRPETELLADTALDEILRRESAGHPVTVVEVGTGSGNVAVSLAAYSQFTQVLATDVSAAALALAARNAHKYGLEQRIVLFCGPLFQPLAGKGFEHAADIVVGNLPYIPPLAAAPPDASAADHPAPTLPDTGAYGANFLRRLIWDALTFLKSGGILAFEIGPGQEEEARSLLDRTARYSSLRLLRDAAGHVRVLCATRK